MFKVKGKINIILIAVVSDYLKQSFSSTKFYMSVCNRTFWMQDDSQTIRYDIETVIPRMIRPLLINKVYL